MRVCRDSHILESYICLADSDLVHMTMAEQSVLEIRLKSEDLTPDKMSSRDIARLISSFEQMIAHIVARDFPELAIDEKQVTVGLSAIHIGSYGVQFKSQYDLQVRVAYETAISAVKTKNFSTLPRKSVDALKVIRNISRTYRTETQFGYHNGQFKELTAISGSTLIDVRIPEITGETTLYGELISIGGINPPTATLILNDGQKISCNVTESANLAVAKQLGKRLYTEVGVQGEARWDLRDMSITFFRIDELLAYEAKPIVEAIENSYDTLGKHLESIDNLEDYFAKLRDSNEDF